MPFPLLAAVAAPASALWGYNRANFLHDSGQKTTRTYNGMNYQMQQWQLYRQDIRDLVALTTEKMTNYHVVACLELGMTVTLLGPARLPESVPEWVLWHQLICLCSAFVFLVMSMWLATRAAVAAGSLNVRLQTQYIRLPLPDDEMLDNALTKADEFESYDLENILRLPFLRHLWHKFQGESRRMKTHASMNSSGVPEASPSNQALLDAAPEASPSPSEIDVEEAAADEMENSGPGHLELYQMLQRKWSCYDAYSRVSMSVGTFWLILSLAYYEVGWNLCHLEKGRPAIMAAIMLSGVVVLLVYLDIFVTQKEMCAATLLILAGPTTVAVGAALGSPEEIDATPPYAVVADLIQIMLSAWFWHLGRIVPGKDSLPMRWKGVSYLDIFGPLVKEVRAILEKSGLGANAAAAEEESDGDYEDLFDFVDKDRSGSISREEWNKAFDEIDHNGSGTITRPEWRRHRGQGCIFDVIDMNHNGAISHEEWNRAFDTFDCDGDGTISTLEWYGQRNSSLSIVEPRDVTVGLEDEALVAKMQNARIRLRAAIKATDVTEQKHQRMLKTALQVGRLVGLSLRDPLIQEAQMLINKHGMPRELKRLRRILEDWRDGEVSRHLNQVQRMEVDRMCEGLDGLAPRLGLLTGNQAVVGNGGKAGSKGVACMPIGKPAENGLPTIMRSISDASTLSSAVPVWTRVEHHRSGAYWVGTATKEGRWGFADEAPSDAKAAEFEDVKQRYSALVECAEKVLANGRKLRADPRKFGQKRAFSLMSIDSIERLLPFDDEDEEERRKNRSRHHPVLVYNLTALALIGVWTAGAVVHGVRFGAESGLLDSRWALHGRRLAVVLAEEAAAVASGPPASFEWPDALFAPRSLQCLPSADAEATSPRRIFASNGFLVYGMQLTPSEAFDRKTSSLRCGVEHHQALVSAQCTAEDGECIAVVAVDNGLWQCSTSEVGKITKPLASVSSSYTRGRPPLEVWADSDGSLSRVFAAPRRGSIVELRRDDGDVLRPVAEISPPEGISQSMEWQTLAVTPDNTLMALATPGPVVASWSLDTGSFLGTRALNAPGGLWNAWCSSGGEVFGTRPGKDENGSVELWRLPERVQ